MHFDSDLPHGIFDPLLTALLDDHLRWIELTRATGTHYAFCSRMLRLSLLFQFKGQIAQSYAVFPSTETQNAFTAASHLLKNEHEYMTYMLKHFNAHPPNKRPA